MGWQGVSVFGAAGRPVRRRGVRPPGRALPLACPVTSPRPPDVTEGEGGSRRGAPGPRRRLHLPARQYPLTSIGVRRDFHESRFPHPAALHPVTDPRMPWGRSRTPVNPIRRTSFDVWHHRATLPSGKNKGAKQKIHHYRASVVPFTFPHCAEEP
ncbi:hypothetical protein Franean1_4143 [Parafrankia sp. EAN1pec]|nr:hypothetical protein Franean1_4143 [Frankia sp. EAN1pec]